MKKIIVFICVLLFSSILFSQQQDKFIIGVDWIGPTWPHPHTSFQPLSENYWDLVESFGVNFGRLTIGSGNANYIQKITNELAKADARGISIFLETYNNTGGRRWMYQVEDDYDFGSHASGESVFDEELIAEQHWSQVNVNPNSPNFWQLTAGTHQAGYVAEDLINDSEIPDGTNYYTKLRIRKTSSVISGSVPVVRVVIINKNNGNIVNEKTIYANELNQNEWTEKYFFVFYKAATGPYDFVEGAENIILSDSLGMLGVEDYAVTVSTYTPYEIKIEWLGDVSCDLDYLIIEDGASYSLYNGSYNGFYTNWVNQVKGIPGLGRIKLWEEPLKENLLPLRYQKRLIDNILAGSGYENKNLLTFHVPPIAPKHSTPQQFLAQTELDNLFSFVYPILIELEVPSDPIYTQALQNQLNSWLVYVDGEIKRANVFEKPFWFVPQAHEWNKPPDQIWLREPSAYEIKTLTNLVVCYGAKGVHYFMYSQPDDGNVIAGATLLDDDDINSPIPRYTDYYGYPKWETVKLLNYKLASIGDELMNLTWQNACNMRL